MPDLVGIKQRLEKKGTFEGALADLTRSLKEASSSTELGALWPLVSRVYTLLKARYSNISFWQQGHGLFQACLEHQGWDAQQTQKLQAYVADAQQFAEDSGPEAPAHREPTLGELLLGLPPPQPVVSHLSDAGLVLEEPPRPVRPAAAAGGVEQQEGGAAATAGTTADSEQAEATGAEAAGLAEAADGLPAEIREVLMQLAGRSGGGDTAAEEQLMEMLARMAEELTGGQAAGGSSRPPASKRVVASLPRTTLDDEQLKTLGPGACCPVCTEDYAAGDEIQKLPCSHSYHVPCLAPWLQQHNSCPICRHELPTDDHAYEARKEREQQEEEDRRGAANALSHSEFLYI